MKPKNAVEAWIIIATAYQMALTIDLKWEYSTAGSGYSVKKIYAKAKGGAWKALRINSDIGYLIRKSIQFGYTPSFSTKDTYCSKDSVLIFHNEPPFNHHQRFKALEECQSWFQ